MRAARLHEYTHDMEEPLSIDDVPRPEPTGAGRGTSSIESASSMS
jgi:hypothetical protein